MEDKLRRSRHDAAATPGVSRGSLARSGRHMPRERGRTSICSLHGEWSVKELTAQDGRSNAALRIAQINSATSCGFLLVAWHGKRSAGASGGCVAALVMLEQAVGAAGALQNRALAASDFATRRQRLTKIAIYFRRHRTTYEPALRPYGLAAATEKATALP